MKFLCAYLFRHILRLLTILQESFHLPFEQFFDKDYSTSIHPFLFTSVLVFTLVEARIYKFSPSCYENQNLCNILNE